MQQQRIQALGIAWFAEDDYSAFRQLLPGRDWHDTFHEWEAAAQQHIASLRHQGIRAIKAHVRADVFAQWCRRTGLNIDDDALRAWANAAALRVIKDGH